MIDDPLNRLNVKRGQDLPQSKLNDYDVRQIREIVEFRDSLKKQLKELTNAKIAEKYDLHVRTIDRITTGENWGHVV